MLQKLKIGAFLDKDSGIVKTIGVHIISYMNDLRYSRIQENEADRLALLYMNKAGYKMQGAIQVLNKFKSETREQSTLDQWLSTHPDPEKRLENVNKAIAKLNKNPDHAWGGIMDNMAEKAKIEAIEYYLSKVRKSK